MKARTAFHVTVALALFGIFGASAFAQAPGSAPGAASSTPVPSAGAPPQADGSGRTLERGWWNLPQIVTDLSLTEAQRKKMDARLKQAIDEQQKTQPEQVERRKKFEEALRDGDWSGARRSAADLHTQMGKMLSAQSELKIDIMTLLTPEQRHLLADKHPPVLHRPWTAPTGERMGPSGTTRARLRRQ